MERLTFIDHLGWYVNGNGGERIRGSHINRLAAYEDTGLEPEEIRWLGDLRAMKREIIFGVTAERLKELAEADKAGRLVVLPFIPHSTMLNLSDPENLEVMEDVRLYVAWKSPSGIVFNSPYSIFLQNIEKGYIKPDIEDAEAALALKGGTHEADSV